MRGNLIELRGNQSPEREGRDDPDRETGHHRCHALTNDQSKDVAGLRAERHAHADLAGALLNRVSDRAVNSEAGEQHATPAKMPSNDVMRRVWPTACATIVFIDCGSAMASPGSTLANADAPIWSPLGF